MKNLLPKLCSFLIIFTLSGFGFSVDSNSDSISDYWDFPNSQRWIGDSAEGGIEYCKEKSIRWLAPQLGFDINKDSIDDFMVAISCYQGEISDDEKHNLKVRAAWKMYCSNDQGHFDCTKELFQSEVIEVTAVPSDVDLGNDGGGNPYTNVSEKPRDLNNDGYPEFWYAINRDDGREGFNFSNSSDYALLESFCGPQPQTNEEKWLWDCTRKSIQTMLVSNSDGTYQIKKMPWGVQNTQAMLILPNEIGTFDVWALIYGPNKVARYKDGDFIDVTEEYEQDPLWETVTNYGNPYAKAFAHDGSFYVAKADIPPSLRPDWAKDFENSGFVLWKYTVGQGFSLSDVFIAEQNQTFIYKIQQGDTVQERFGVMIKDVPVFDPRWHFFNLEVLDDSGEPILIVQSEAFTQAGDFFKAPHDSDIIYKVGDIFSTQSTTDSIWGGYSAIQGFYIRDGKLVERTKEVIEGNGIHGAEYKRFTDINSDGHLDTIVYSGEGIPSVYLNNGSGTLIKLFLGDVFPDLLNNGGYWEVSEDHNIPGWGAILYPFYSSSRLDLLYWTKGYQFRMPSYLPEGYSFSPGDIVLTRATLDTNEIKTFSVKEQHTLFETCVSNGWFAKHGYQLACKLGIPFLDEGEIDSDNDGVYDNEDSFRFDDSESLDTDADGIGNNADDDDDNDGVVDAEDAFPLIDLGDLTDTDSDGRPNECDTACVDLGMSADTDDDGDEVLDTVDAFPLDATESVDTDGDDIGNNADPDDDGDGVLDINDPYPLNAPPTLSFTYGDNTNKPIAGITLTLTESDTTVTTLTSDANGQVKLPLNPLATNTYTLSASLAVTDTDPISVQDALYILQHIVELRTLDTLQIKAADINSDDSITIQDALKVLQHNVELITIENPLIFLDANTNNPLAETTFSPTETPSITVYRLGDVNLSFNPGG